MALNKKTPIDILKRLFEISFGIFITLALFLLSIDNYKALLNADKVQGLLACGLFITTVLWTLGWFYFDFIEITLFGEYLDIRQAKGIIISPSPFLSGIFLAVLGGILFSVAVNLYFYIPLVILILSIGINISQIASKTIRKCKSTDDSDFEIFEVICDYYQNRQFILLDLISIIILIIPLVLNVYSLFLPDKIYIYSAYVLTIIVILAHETVLWIWRMERQKKIQILELDLEGE